MSASLTDTLSQGLQAHQLGDFDSAEVFYQAILKADPAQSNVLQLLGMLYHDKGELLLAHETFHRVLALHPDSPSTHHALGNLLCQQKQYGEGIHHLQQALCIEPENDDFLLDLAIAYQSQGDYANALSTYQRVLTLFPNHPDALSNLGNVYRALNRTDEAIECFETALAMEPSLMEAYINLSSLYQAIDNIPKAMACCIKGLSSNPNTIPLLEALAALYYQVDEKTKALETYETVMGIDPRNARAHFNMGTLLFELERAPEAESHFQAAIAQQPDYEEAYSGLGNVYHRLGHYDEAVEAFAKASELQPSKKLLQWRSMTTCPVVYDTVDQITTLRNRIQTHLDGALEADFPFSLEEFAYSGCEPSFFLAYQGFNDAPLKSRFGDVFYNMLQRRYPHLLERPALRLTQDKIHIGFLVTEKHEGVFCKLNAGYLNHLNPQRFNVTVFCHSSSVATIQGRLTRSGVQFVILPEGLEDCVNLIKPIDLDVLLYYEVGSDALNYFLPLFNLAPIQCTSYGYPVTSGLPTMDYFLTSQQVELPNAQEHYRETIYKMAWDPIYFYKQTSQMKDFQGRETYGFTEKDQLYLCPQNLFKLHPDFDSTMLSILARNNNAQVLLLTSLWPAWQERLVKRIHSHPLAKQYPQVLDRLHFMPRQYHHGYLNLLAISDVMLDTLHYTGGTTSFEGLMMGLPIVSRPYETTRSRQTLGNYHSMGMHDCLVHSEEEYINLALRLGNDGDYNRDIREKILATNPILFENPGVISEMEGFLEWAIRQHGGNTPQ